MKTFLVISFFVITQALNAQNLINIYEDYIPKKLIENFESRNNIEKNLSYNADVHPDLIYYYIEHLISFYLGGVTNPDSNYLNQLRHQRNQYLKERSSWASIQNQNIGEITNVKLKRNAMTKFYEEVINIPKESYNDIITLKKDDNLQEFFNYLYFSKMKSIYDTSKNYFQINKNLIENHVSILNEEYDDFNNFNFDQKIEKIGKDVKFWYLTGYSNSNKYGISTNYQASELSIQTFDKSFLTRNTFVFGLTINGFIDPLPDINKTFLFTDKPLPTFIDPISFNFPVGLSYYPLLSADVGYQFALKPELELFSYINVKLGYTLIIAKYDDINKDTDFYSFTYNYISGTAKQVYVYKSAGVINNSNHLGFIKASIPVFYFNKSFYFELGVDISARFLKYDYQIQKQSVLVEGEQETVESVEYTNLSFEDSKTNVSPFLSIIVEPLNNFNISLNNSVLWDSYLLAISLNYKL